jgi:hypothetical protein
MFPVYGGKCLSRKAVHNWVDKFSQGRSEVTDDSRPGAAVAETTIKRLRRTGKAMGHVYQCRWRICREINVFSSFEYMTCFTLYIYLWPIYWLSLIYFFLFYTFPSSIWIPSRNRVGDNAWSAPPCQRPWSHPNHVSIASAVMNEWDGQCM